MGDSPHRLRCCWRSSGFAALDAELPGAAGRAGGLVSNPLPARQGIGELSLLTPALAHVSANELLSSASHRRCHPGAGPLPPACRSRARSSPAPSAAMPPGPVLAPRRRRRRRVGGLAARTILARCAACNRWPKKSHPDLPLPAGDRRTRIIAGAPSASASLPPTIPAA